MRPVKDILTAVTAALLALGLAAVAIAQAPGTDVRPDTEFTPTPRDEGLDGRWKQRGGAVWRADASSQTPPAMAEGSTAPMTVDFYGVSFLDESNGLAVGAACAADTAYDDLDTCERRPAIYTYTELPGEPAQWLPAELDGAEAPGYVADVAWIGPGRALAVGGTGRYPYREPATPIADDEDPAGNGRVWLLEDGAWTELARPEGLGALTAIAMSERPGDCGATTECGAVGGLRQLWTWRDGELHREEVTDAFRFRFRVRDIVFAPGAEPPALGLPKAYAVTSGCCSGDPTADLPSLLVLGEGQWYGRSPWAGGGNAPLTSAGARTLVDSLYSVMLSQRDEGGGVAAGTWTLSYVSAPGRTRGAAPADAPAIAPDEPASRIIGRIPSTAPEETGPQSNQTVTVVFDAANGPVIVDDTGTVTSEATNPLLADVRLVSGGGDLGRTVPQGVRRESPLPGEGPDGVMDWAVGEQVSTGRALAMTTLESGETVPNPFDCPGDDKRLLGTTPDCRPAADPAGKARSRRFLALPSYRLNSFAAVGVAGEAWAVGDKGAIMQLGGDGGGSLQLEEPNPPKLPRTSATTPPDTSAWDPFRPVSLTTEPGVVPPLATRPREPLIEPALEPAGTADPSRRHGTEDGVSAFAMSPDGREGWAVGPRYGTSTEAATLHHYDGERWYPCDPVGIGDQVAADEACAGLSELLSESGANAAEIETIVRVPYENDDEPGNDDRFEAVAVGRAGATSFVLRYDGARWGTMPLAPDNGANTYTDVEFTSPTDGWLAAESVGEPSLYRWDGTAWTDCRTDAAACGFAPGQLPLDSTTARPLHLARAGDRLYLGGNRKTASSGGNNDVPTFPFILYRDGEDGWTAEDGGYDPFAGGEAADQGWLQALSVAPEGDGYRGWAIGRFGGDPDRLPLRPASDAQQRLTGAASAAALHLDGEDWTPWTEDDALADHFRGNETASTVVLTLPDSDGEAFAIRRGGRALGPAPPVRFSPDARRWEVVATPFDASTGSVASGHAVPQALGAAPDGSVWLVALGGGDTSVGRRGRSAEISAFYRFDDERTKPVFEDVAHPIREDITDVAATKDGGVWVSTAGNAVYRYDRVTGWDRMTVPGWASSGAARAARANAIAVGPDGRGLVVGQAGRIAEVGPLGLQLDAAAGTACAAGAPPPCGTARDLHAVAIAPDDGSAIAAGDGRVVLWRKPGEGFRALPPPPGLPFGARFTSASMPSSSEVYLTADTGHVVAGLRDGDDWTWRIENLDADGKVLALDEKLSERRALALRDVAVDADGQGFAVGDEGLVLQRDGAGGTWRRLPARYRDDFTRVALPPAPGQPGALIGARQGLILTLVDGELRVARHADPHDPLVTATGSKSAGIIAGLALLPGTQPGQVEAWAALQVPPDPTAQRSPLPQAMLHYTSDPDDELLDGVARVRPLPDAPLPRPGEVAFAAFGRSDCHAAPSESCSALTGTKRFNDVISDRIVKELLGRAEEPGGPVLALFTGDVDRAAGRNETVATPLDRNVAHRRWLDRVASRLQRGGLPLYAAVGGGDLAQVKACTDFHVCAGGEDTRQARTNSLWRETMATMPEPWGAGDPPASAAGLEFEPVGGPGAAEAPGGGASTHYAFDVKRGDETLMRVAVVDTSHGSLAASEREQQPVEAGGQNAWLDSVLCRRGSASGAAQGCTLDPETPSVVVGNTPTYSYGPGGMTETMTDSATFEAKLLQHKVTTMVSGRLGWNGRYFATAPGLHFPCPNGEYPTGAPPRGAAPDCSADTTAVDQARAQAGAAAEQAADAVQSLNPPDAPQPLPVAPDAEEQLAQVTGTVTGLVDFVVASGGGGRLANERGEAGDGFWHGYTLVRLMPGNDVARTVVEQRPVFDWISVTAERRILRPGGTTTVRGVGREPVGGDHHIRYDRIDSPAITHRYDLVRADPEKPWRPLLDADGNYVPLPASVATIDKQNGQVKAGGGNQERTYGLAILSVGEDAAALPLAFEPRRSFQAPDPPVSASATNVTISNPPQQPPIIVLGTAAATAPPPTSPPPGATPSNLSPTFPPPLQFSAPPPINATPTATPPPPPPAPPPPANEGAAPLNLSLKVSGLNIAPQMSTFPPPAPPVNPAPPGGARKEARQRQAAVAKSEQGGDGKGEGADAHGRSDAVDSPNSAMTRLDQGKGNSMAFAAYERREQPSAWARGALYGGGLTLAAFLMAMTWTTARPRARRRTPEVPAPAYARRRRY